MSSATLTRCLWSFMSANRVTQSAFTPSTSSNRVSRQKERCLDPINISTYRSTLIYCKYNSIFKCRPRYVQLAQSIKQVSLCSYHCTFPKNFSQQVNRRKTFVVQVIFLYLVINSILHHVANMFDYLRVC